MTLQQNCDSSFRLLMDRDLLETAVLCGAVLLENRKLALNFFSRKIEVDIEGQKLLYTDSGKEIDGKIEIISNNKSWWSIVEGLNALLMMHYLYPDDPNNYYEKFEKTWSHIDAYLVDKEYGGWYSRGQDTNPGSEKGLKSHAWKTTYHNVRGLVNCVRQLRHTYSHH